MISIVIPIYNEEEVLFENLSQFRSLSHKAEIIFVDGGSSDRSVDIINGCGKIIKSKKGRAVQMNYGASQAQGDILLFLHADNTIYPEALKSIEDQVEKNNYVGGCLTQRINKEGMIFRFIEGQGNFRARSRKIFYGDQGIFVRKDVFWKMNGFPDVPILEDIIFSKKLGKFAKTTVVLPDKILASPRRWEKNGVIRTILLYNLIIILFCLKFPLERINRLYGDLR